MRSMLIWLGAVATTAVISTTANAADADDKHEPPNPDATPEIPAASPS